jgi:hypothetical protein
VLPLNGLIRLSAHAHYFVILFCLTPDDFTHQGESAATQWDSRCVTVYPITYKSEVLDKFKEWEAVVTNQADCKIKTLRTDNGGEYMSAEFQISSKRKVFITRQLYPTHHNRMVSPNG